MNEMLKKTYYDLLKNPRYISRGKDYYPSLKKKTFEKIVERLME